MRDPFRPNTNKQLVREAQFGFTVIGLLIAVLIYVAYYRLSGLDDIAPPHIQDTPVAMQVFPTSPNYDRETNLMRDREPPTRVASRSSFPTKSESPLVSAPKRILDDSKNTFRSLSKTAKSIEDSAAKVKSLSLVPINKKPFGLVSNPAADTAKDSGFKITNQLKPNTNKPKPDAATRHLPESNPARPKEVAPIKPTSDNRTQFNSSIFKSLTNQFAPSAKSNPLKPAPLPVKSPPKIDLPTGGSSNDFKPLPPKPTAPPTPSKDPFKMDLSGKAQLPSSPIKAEEKMIGLTAFKTQSLDRETQPAEKPAFESLSPASKTPVPTIETVAFEQTTWTVKKGDSFWSIAQSHYGDGRFFRALYEQNRRIVPGFENLTVGTELFLPSTDELIKKHTSLCPSDAVRKDDPWRATPDDLMDGLTEAADSDLDQRLYETKPGDTLFGVARQQLGQASRYVELMKLNEFRIDSNMNHETKLPPGIQLLLPLK